MSKCVNNCGFFGNEQTDNYCSKCFGELASKTKNVGVDDSASCCSTKEQTKKNRCWECNKKIGLTGVKCKCDYVFCNIHRHPEKHNCCIDYKNISRKDLSKDNPLIIASKIEKM